jgi:hypothetical protein
MARAQYFVANQQGLWKITFNGQQFGPYASEEVALKSAIEAAQSSGSRGHDAQVLVLGVNNEFVPKWTYGHDPYPPAS